MAVTACAGHGGATATAGSTPAPAAQASQVDQTPEAGAPTPTDGGAYSATPADSGTPSQSSGAATSAAPATSGVPAATPDPLAGQISNLKDILNGINSSLSGSDAGTSGGE
jgi:hypothetical protein